MNRAPQKDWLDIAIDFFFGAAFGDVLVALGCLRVARQQFNWAPILPYFAICLFASTLIAGSMAAPYRNEFWSKYETYSIIPPIEENISKRARIVLWSLFALGCASLGFLFVV